MSQSHGSNSQSLHTSVAGKVQLRKLTESKTFYIFTFSLKFKQDLWVQVIFSEV